MATATTLAATTYDWSTITSALTSSFSAAEIMGIIAAIVGVGAGLCLVWLGARKIVNAVISAFKSGKIHF